jgi:hypothetical protein
MLLSSLLPLLSTNHRFFGARTIPPKTIEIPSLQQIQSGMNQMWSEGWDPDGAKHYSSAKGGQREIKQIGAVEVANWCNFNYLDVTTVQFICCQQSRSLLGPFCFQYFTSNLCHQQQKENSEFSDCDSTTLARHLLSETESKPTDFDTAYRGTAVLPLYLQWPGHSVTIIGVIQALNVKGQNISSISAGLDLLIFDPSKSGSKLMHRLEQQNVRPPVKQGSLVESLIPFRLPLARLKGKDCQVLVSTPRNISATEREMRRLRFMSSVVTADEKAVLRFQQSMRE